MLSITKYINIDNYILPQNTLHVWEKLICLLVNVLTFKCKFLFYFVHVEIDFYN